MKLFRNQSGQGMTEYIIIVAVIALACIAAFAYFGKSIKSQTAAMSHSLAGDKTKADASIQKADEAGDSADTEAAKDVDLKQYTEGTTTTSK